MRNFLILGIAVLSFSGCGRENGERMERHYQTGMAYLKNQQVNQAIREFEECLKIDPKNCSALKGLGTGYFLQKQFDLSIEILRKGLDLCPEKGDLHYMLAHALQGKKDIEGAYNELQSLLEIRHDHIRGRLKLVEILMENYIDMERSREELEKILKMDPENLEAHFRMGRVHLQMSDFLEAEKELKYCIGRSTGDFEYRFFLGVTYLRKGDYPKAIQAFKDALQIKPDDLVAKWNLRIAYEWGGKNPDSIEEKYRLVFLQKKIDVIPVTFKDVAVEAGVAKVDGGRGSAWGDFDKDGDLDIFTVGTHKPHALFRNNGNGKFTDVALSSGLKGSNGFGSLFADYDNDGDLDIYVTKDGWFGKGRNSLFVNNGNGTFRDVTEEAGVGDTTGSSFAASWGDLDNDGFLDLYIANGIFGEGSPNRLYRNNGDGTFTDIARNSGVDNRGRAIGCALGDYDGDGDLDIHVVNLGEANILYRNNGDGTFTDVTRESGALITIERGFVTFFFDYNNDTHLDIFISNQSVLEEVLLSKIKGVTPNERSRLVLLRGNGDGTFSDVTREAQIALSYGSMAANYGDVDNDGFLDIYLANGGPDMDWLEPDAFLYNNGDGTFSDVTEEVGLGNLGKGHGVTFGDYDSDGDLDIYAPIGGAFIGDMWPNSLYRNNGSKNNWLVVKTIGTRSNRDGIGAKITLTSADLTLFRVVDGGSGFGSTNSLPVEFGLGQRKRVARLVIRWPSGLVETYEDLPVNQFLIATEGKGIEEKKFPPLLE